MSRSGKTKINWEVKDAIGFVVLSDEPKNSMDAQFFQELHMLTTKVIPVSGVKAVIISGKGRHFSSGADLDELRNTIKNQPGNHDFLLANYRSFRYFDEMMVPVIMAIKGVCLGAGLEMALHGHFRICSREAILGLPESTFGLIPGAGGIRKMLQVAGKAQTIQMVLQGNSIGAEEALEKKIVDAVFPKKILMEKAIELAELAAVNYRKDKKTEYLKKLILSDDEKK